MWRWGRGVWVWVWLERGSAVEERRHASCRFFHHAQACGCLAARRAGEESRKKKSSQAS